MTISDTLADTLPTTVTVIAVTGTLALARVLFRFKPPVGLTEEDMAAVIHRTRNYNKAAAAFAVIAALVVGFGFWFACRTVAAEWDRAMPAHVFLCRTTTGESPDLMWAIPGGFAAMVSAYWGHVLGIRLLFGRHGLQEWQLACRHKEGFDGHRFLVALSILTLCGSLVAAGLLLDSYTRAEEERFVENDVFGFGEKSRPYTDVKSIAVTTHVRGQNDEESERSRLHIYFADGTEWAASPADAYQPLTEFLVRKTGKPVVQARHEEELANK